MKPAPASPFTKFHTLHDAVEMLNAGRSALAWTAPLATAMAAWTPPPAAYANAPMTVQRHPAADGA